MFSSFHDFVLRLSLGIRQAPPAGMAYPPYFPDTASTRHGINLVRVATVLLAVFAGLHRIAIWPAAIGLTKLAWVSCAVVGLALMSVGVLKAIRARMSGTMVPERDKSTD